MGAPTNPNPHSEQDASPRFRRMLPSGEELRAQEIVDGLDFEERALELDRRPYVVLNMTSTVDGRASVAGRSGGIGNRADRELFHGLRATVDAVMAGAGTVRTERYGRIIADEASRRLRRERGRSEEPLACIVSGRLSLPSELPLLAEPAARVVIVTASTASLSETAAHVEYVRSPPGAGLQLGEALHELKERFGVRTLLCEGGPHLNSELLGGGLVDELFLSLSPRLAGGDQGVGEQLRILAGEEFDPLLELELIEAVESGSQLFLRYGVRASAPERVTRETMPRSSLES